MSFLAYDKNGKAHSFIHAVDAKEAIATGYYFKHNPIAGQKAPAQIETATIRTGPGEDITAQDVSLTGMEVDVTAQNAKEREKIEETLVKPKEEPLETDGQPGPMAPSQPAPEGHEFTEKGELKVKDRRPRRS